MDRKSKSEGKRANQNVVDGDEDVVPHKRVKGERKVAARSLFYRHLSKEGKLIGFKNNAERNTFFANEWEKVDDEKRKEMESEAARINENRANEMNDEEKMSAIKLHKKKLLREISILESFGVETTVVMLHGDQVSNFGSEKGLAFLDAHPSFNMEIQRYYDVTENEKQYTYKDLQVLFNRSYARAIKCENARVPYLKGNFVIEGLPDSVAWRKMDGSIKKPTDYGQKQINEIMANKDQVKFTIDSTLEAGTNIRSQSPGLEPEQRNEINEVREQPSVPTCILKLVSTEVAERAMNDGAQINKDEVDVLVQIREDEAEALLRDFGHLFTEDDKNAITNNSSFGRGVIFPVYTKNKRLFWLFHYDGIVSQIENAPSEATIPGRWLDHERGPNFKVLPETTSIKKINIICNKDGNMLSIDHCLQDNTETVKVEKAFLKTIKDTLKSM
eukprot:Seg4667.2 transcript_id=Seg4667.2/GoldUCD/mRNA.D3Y31 product="hypothetical protein" protein_id=Seg4667.2/GoldUCD/D3Y31